MQCRTTRLDVSNVICYFFLSELSEGRCVGTCTDGATSMTGKHSGAVACKKEKSLSVKQMHCMIHREVLIANI